MVSLAGASGTDDLSKYLFEFRYQHPTGYANGNAALGVIGMLAAFGLSTDRDANPVLAGLFLAVAALLADFALLSQSRGSFIGVAVATPVFLIFAPDRLRVLTRLLALAGAVALAAGPIFDVYNAGEVGRRARPRPGRRGGGHPCPPCSSPAPRGCCSPWRSEPRAGTSASRPPAGAPGTRASPCSSLAVVAIGLVNLGRITDTVDEQWATLTGAEYDSVEGARISNLDPYERPDYWRVAIDLFQESPVTGVGTGNFEREYTARRHEPKHSRYVHNMFLRALGEGGFVGAALLAAFFLSLFVAGGLLRRRLARAPSLVLATALAIAAYFAVHLNFDWLEEIPAVASPALALPIVALVVAARPPGGESAGAVPRAPRARGPGWPRGLAGIALVALVPAYLSVRYVNRAEERAAVDVDSAFEDLDRARSLNPASLDPDLAEGRIAISARRYDVAREAFEHSLTVEDNWLAHFELALINTGRGRFGPAAAQLRQARALNARDPVLTRLSRNIEARRRVDPKAREHPHSEGRDNRFTTSGR